MYIFWFVSRASICSNEALPWDVVDGFSKERSSLRYFRILIQTQKVFTVYIWNKPMSDVAIQHFTAAMQYVYKDSNQASIYSKPSKVSLYSRSCLEKLCI